MPESHQAPHQKLTEEQIKEIISNICIDIFELKEFFKEQFEEVENKLRLLNRHFFPEKFKVSYLSLETMQDMLTKEHGDIDLREPMSIKRPVPEICGPCIENSPTTQEKDGVAETDAN